MSCRWLLEVEPSMRTVFHSLEAHIASMRFRALTLLQTTTTLSPTPDMAPSSRLSKHANLPVQSVSQVSFLFKLKGCTLRRHLSDTGSTKVSASSLRLRAKMQMAPAYTIAPFHQLKAAFECYHLRGRHLLRLRCWQSGAGHRLQGAATSQDHQ